MALLDTVEWNLISLLALCLINLAMVIPLYSKVRRQRVKIHSQKRRISDLDEDVRALYESASTFGNKLHTLEISTRVLKEQQEQLTLKEPNQQTYRNAIKAIHNGDSVNQVADSSGLSRGEVELLTLLQNINQKESSS